MIYLSAGHNRKIGSPDPGAIGINGIKEADLTIELRDLIAAQIKLKGYKYILDNDQETLAEYIKRVKPGSGSVLLELHFNAGVSTANGAETLIEAAFATKDKHFGEEINKVIVNSLSIKNRGVKTEAESHRGRLGILHTPAGVSALAEICFITNKEDLDKYNKNKQNLAKEIANILVKYEDLYS